MFQHELMFFFALWCEQLFLMSVCVCRMLKLVESQLWVIRCPFLDSKQNARVWSQQLCINHSWINNGREAVLIMHVSETCKEVVMGRDIGGLGRKPHGNVGGLCVSHKLINPFLKDILIRHWSLTPLFTFCVPD